MATFISDEAIRGIEQGAKTVKEIKIAHQTLDDGRHALAAPLEFWGLVALALSDAGRLGVPQASVMSNGILDALGLPE